MKTSEYATMAEREKNYWWHLGRLRIIQKHVSLATKGKKNVKIMNVGCGTGGTIDMLEQFGQVDNIDISDEAIKFMKDRGYKRIMKGDAVKMPVKDGTYDMVGAFDILEHIEQELDALREWARVIKKDGAVVISVPAYQWLWTGHDVSLHHKRRYTVARLVKAAQEAGLRADKKTYAIVFSLPLVVGFRFLNKLLRRKATSETSYVNVPGWMNRLFTQLLYIEAAFHGKVRFPFGTSVVTVLRKAEAGEETA